MASKRQRPAPRQGAATKCKTCPSSVPEPPPPPTGEQAREDPNADPVRCLLMHLPNGIAHQPIHAPKKDALCRLELVTNRGQEGIFHLQKNWYIVWVFVCLFSSLVGALLIRIGSQLLSQLGSLSSVQGQKIEMN